MKRRKKREPETPVKPRAEVNYGIQARYVKAEALAVGHGAHAHKSTQVIPNSNALSLALDSFRNHLAAASAIPDPARAVVEKHLKPIESEAKKRRPSKAKVKDSIGGITRILNGTTKLAADLSKLMKPLGKLANVFGIAVTAMGLR